jgi:putative membrane protein
MIAYNPKDWLKLIFIFHKSDTFRMLLPALLIAAAYSTLLTYLSIEVHYLEFKSTTVIHSLLGFVISMLLVFRTNTAYDRWWEGRKLWGELVNSSRNFALKINTMIPSEAKNEKDNLNILIGNFPFVLKEHLRGRFKAVEFETNKTITIEDLNKVNHKPNALIWAIEKEVMQAYKNKNITNEQLLLLNDELKTMANVCGACERIKNTPIPYSYSMFLKKFIFAYVFTMPLGFVYDFKYWTAPIVVFIFYAFASIELIAEEIEDPFGTDANDLPLDAIAITIRTNVKEIATFE